MDDEIELALAEPPVTLLEEDAKGERTGSRHILRKVTENETLLLQVRKEVSDLRNEVVTLRADLPGIIATSVTAILREELARKKV